MEPQIKSSLAWPGTFELEIPCGDTRPLKLTVESSELRSLPLVHTAVIRNARQITFFYVK